MTDPVNPFKDHPAMEKLAGPKWNSTVEARLRAWRAHKTETQTAWTQRATRRAHKALWKARGERYRRCTLGNFETTPGSKQETVLKRIAQFAGNLDEEIRLGTNLLLTGEKGTGKDHLVAALMTLAMAAGHIVKWTSGAMLVERLHFAIANDEDEAAVRQLYTRPTVLVVSDPAWEHNPLSRYQQEKFGGIVDTRYNHLRPTWITLNATDRKEADELLGEALVDRLCHEAVSIWCNWPSYRKSRPEEEMT